MRQTRVFVLKSHPNANSKQLSRSEVMAKVLSKDTKPEIIVRSLLHAMGYRFRLHRKDLPGSPDIVLPGKKAVIFVHGCFWHGHDCKRGDRPPVNNAEYWNNKRSRNVARDAQHIIELESLGWRVLVIWECEIKRTQDLKGRLISFLDDARVQIPPV